MSSETVNYRFWEKGFSDEDFGEFELVVVVDIAFRFKNPVQSLMAVLVVADAHPDTHFLIVDHHPLPSPDQPRPNLSLVETSNAYYCCVGTPSDELMVLAAICDGDGEAVRSRTSHAQEKRAAGVRRAAADMGGIAGPKLLGLLARRRWDFFEDLADEAPEFHKRVRGRRTTRSLTSPLLEAANAGMV